MQVQYWSFWAIIRILILTHHTESHHLLLWPYQLPFDRWPFHTGHVLQDRRVSSHYSQGQPKNRCRTPSPKPLGQRQMTRNLLPSVAVSMGVRHQLIMAGVNGAGFGSSLEPSTWDCHQAIKSIIFSVRSQDLDGESVMDCLILACMMATFIASLWKDNEWKGENRQKDLQHNNKGQ